MKKSNVLAVAILVASACKCQPIARPMCDSLVIQDLAAHFEDRGQFREDVGFLALALGGLGVFNVTREARIDKTIGWAMIGTTAAGIASLQFVLATKEKRLAKRLRVR